MEDFTFYNDRICYTEMPDVNFHHQFCRFQHLMKNMFNIEYIPLFTLLS